MEKSLKQEYVKAIIEDAELQGKIASLNNKSPQSVLRWAKEKNHKRLTMLGTLEALSKHLGVKKEELVKAA